MIHDQEHGKDTGVDTIALVIEQGFRGPPLLRDEIYLQLWKQTKHNPNEECCVRIWEMLCCCGIAFPPSDQLGPPLMHFFSGTDVEGPFSKYAKFCRATLLRFLSLATVHFTYIQLYKEWAAMVPEHPYRHMLN